MDPSLLRGIKEKNSAGMKLFQLLSTDSARQICHRKAVKWVKAKRTCGGMFSTSGQATAPSSPLHVGLWPAPDFGCPWRGTAGMWMGLDGEMSPGIGKSNSVSSALNHSE